MIRFEGAGKTYPDGTTAVGALDLDVPRGHVTVLVGPSGCGKTTTMRMVNRLVEPSHGRVLVDGRDVMATDVTTLRRGIGYVIQQVGLFPHQTIAANVATVPKLLGWDKRKTSGRVEELLALVGLDPARYADRYPHELSGGQRQRVGVARALAVDPPVLLMDEPFGAVDPVARDRLQEEFLALQRRLGTTVVLVTHDIDEAVRLGDRIAVMSDGGKLEQYDAPAVLLTQPATDYVRDFVGAETTLRRLQVLSLAQLRPGPAAAAPAAALPRSASLAEALARMLADGLSSIGVVDSDGTTVTGSVTADDILAAGRQPPDPRARTSA